MQSLLKKLLVILIVSLTLTTNLKANDSTDFPSYLITPHEPDDNPSYKNAIVVPEAPGHSVCMSELRWREARVGYDTGRIYKDAPCIRTGYNTFDVVLITIGAGLIGFGAGRLMR